MTRLADMHERLQTALRLGYPYDVFYTNPDFEILLGIASAATETTAPQEHAKHCRAKAREALATGDKPEYDKWTQHAWAWERAT